VLARIADLTWNRPKLVLAVVGVFMLASVAVGHDVEKHLKAAGFADESSESERATAVLRDALGYDANPGLVVLVRAKDGGRLNTRSPAVRREVRRISRQLTKARYVGRVVDPLENPRAAQSLVAKDGRSLVVAGYLSSQDVESDGGDAAEDALKLTRSDQLRVTIGGFAASFNEVNDQTRKDLQKAELIAFPILAILLLIVFRGVVAAGIPLFIGVVSILGTFLALRVMASLVDTSLFALNIATALSLGLAVDYALLLVSRYREELEAHGPTRAAHRTTVLTAGRTTLFSGFTVAVAMAALGLLPQRFLYSMAVAGATVALLTAVIAIFVVPALLSILGERVNALSVRSGHKVADESTGWARLARWVMRRPVAVALATLAVLLTLAAPFLSTVLTGPSAEAVPPAQPSYATNTYVQSHYGRVVAEAITVTVKGRMSDAELAKLRAELSAIDGAAPAPPFTRASADVAFLNMAPEQLALARKSQDAVDTIRALDGPSILVSGNTARFMDEKQSLRDNLPRVAAVIALSTFVLLFLLTGSVILPLKTLLMNTLTLGAVLGVIVVSFQDGWLDGPLGYVGPNAIEVTSLVFLFAVTFGLATDYAVLVMARIKEQHDLGMSNEDAVAIGLGRTGRVITAAAVMISVVFIAFGVSSVFFMKQIAVGQAIGVLIDATIVRALLVPALMRLLGEWNWWAPGPLERFQRRFGFQEG
jgi:uncharacterized membrane protein YdfJ with MMPL/SSD domain